MRKIPYTFLCIVVSVNCIARNQYAGIFLNVGVGILLATGIIYLISVLKKKSEIFHQYISYAWIILAGAFAYEFVMDAFSAWNRITLFLCSMIVATLYAWLWQKDEKTESSRFSFFQGIATIVLGMAIAFIPMAVNESMTTEAKFYDLKVIQKTEVVSTQSLWDRRTYYIQIHLMKMAFKFQKCITMRLKTE